MFQLQVLTPVEIFFDDEVSSLIAPGEEGYFGVLTNHAPLITSLKKGVMVITDKNQTKSFFKISGGFLEVSYNHASILVETVEPTAPVDLGIGGGV